jgi:hypothetical protein
MALEASTLIYLALTAVSVGVSAYSSHQAGKAAEDQADYNAKVERNNQAAMSQQADYDVDRTREKYRRIRASQKAAASASGLLPGGSLNDLLQDTNFQEDLDELSILYKAKLNITSSEQQRTLGLMEGKQARTAAKFGVATSLLSGSADAVAKYPTLQKGPKYPTPQKEP